MSKLSTCSKSRVGLCAPSVFASILRTKPQPLLCLTAAAVTDQPVSIYTCWLLCLTQITSLQSQHLLSTLLQPSRISSYDLAERRSFPSYCLDSSSTGLEWLPQCTPLRYDKLNYAVQSEPFTSPVNKQMHLQEICGKMTSPAVSTFLLTVLAH